MAAAAISALLLALFFIGLLAVRNTSKLNPMLQILRKGVLIGIVLTAIGFGIYYIAEVLREGNKENVNEYYALQQSQEAAKAKANLQQLTKQRQQWIIGSWAKKDGYYPATVFTFLSNHQFYTSDYFEGSYKLATDRIFLYYSNGAADYITFKNLGPDMLVTEEYTLIKRPDIIPKKVKVVVAKSKPKPKYKPKYIRLDENGNPEEPRSLKLDDNGNIIKQ